MFIPNKILLINSFITNYKAKAEIRIVGGFVRDNLLGLNPIELDLATTLAPEEVIAAFQKAHITCLPTGLSHGTVTLLLEGEKFEITTLRKDNICYGRKAQVSFSEDWEEDAARRDLTINALYLDLQGNLYDYFGGQEDLADQRVKFIGDPLKRIEEDYLRLLRYFRFLAHFEKPQIDEDSLEATILAKKGLEKISLERIQSEFVKLLSYKNPAFPLKLMINHGIIESFIVIKAESLLDLSWSDKGFLNLCALLYHNPDQQVLQRLKFSRVAMKKARFLCEYDQKKLQKLLGADKSFVTSLVSDLGKAIVKDLIEFAWILYGKQMNIIKPDEIIALVDASPIYSFPISGDDLLKLGFTGKELGLTIQSIKEKWLASYCKMTREELLECLKNNKE